MIISTLIYNYIKIILKFNKRFYLTLYEETVMIRRLIILLLVIVDLPVNNYGCEYVKMLTLIKK